MTIIEKMQSRYEDMTEGEKKIYRHIMENSTVFSLRSIQDVAENLGISKTSLVRFAKMLGFEGYSLFKKSLQEEEILRSTPSQRLRKLQESNYIHSTQKMKDKEISTIQDIYKTTNLEDLKKVIQWMLKSSKIYIAGWRESFFLAEILEYRLKTIGLPTQLLSRSVLDFDEQLIHGKEEELLIGFDFYKYSKAMKQLFQEGQEKSMKTICITDSPMCPSVALGGMSFFCPSKTDYLLNSLTGPLFFINTIVSELYGGTTQQNLSMLEKRELLRIRSQEYENGGNL